MRAGWKISKLGDLYEVQLGKMLNAKAKLGKQYSYLTNYNVRWGSFNLSDLNTMHFNEREKEKFTLETGDLIMCEGGEIGRCAIWSGDSSEVFYQKALHRIRPLNMNHSDNLYLQHYMLYLSLTKKLTRWVGETSIAHLTKEKLVSLPINHPSLREQKDIADVLSTWDQAIEKTEQLIKAKEKKFRFKLSSLIDEGIDKKQFVKLYDLYGEDIFVEKGKPSTKISSKGGVIPVVAGGKNYANFVESSTHIEETVTVSSSGANAGYVWYHNYKIWASDCSVLTTKKSSTKFLYYTLKRLQNKIYALQSGGAQPHVYPKDFKNLKVYWPSLKTQEEIAEILTSHEEEITLLKTLSTHYQDQKRGLMQRLLTGEWRVNFKLNKKYEGNKNKY